MFRSVIGLLLMLLGAGCDPYVRSTALEVRDPTLLHYATTDGRAIPRTPSAPTMIADHDVRVLGNRFAELIVTARSSGDGRLITTWSAASDRLHMERTEAIGGGGKLVVDDRPAVATSANELTFPVCGRYDDIGRAKRGAGGAYLANVYLGTDCALDHDVAVIAETPISNVRSVRYVAKSAVGRSVALATVASILTGAAGATLLLARDDGHALSPAARGVGVGVLAAGAVIDLAIVIPAIFSHDHEDAVYGAAASGVSRR